VHGFILNTDPDWYDFLRRKPALGTEPQIFYLV